MVRAWDDQEDAAYPSNTFCDKGDGTTTTTMFCSGDDEEDAASPSNTFAGTQAASLGPDFSTVRKETVAPTKRAC